MVRLMRASFACTCPTSRRMGMEYLGSQLAQPEAAGAAARSLFLTHTCSLSLSHTHTHTHTHTHMLCCGIPATAHQRACCGDGIPRGAKKKKGTGGYWRVLMGTTPESRRGSPKVNFPLKVVVFKSENRLLSRF